MRGILLGCLLWSVVALPGVVGAVTPSPALTDREIAERLTRMETRLDEGLTGLREDMTQLRTDIGEQNRQVREDMAQLRTDMREQNRQVREDMAQLGTDMREQNRQVREDMAQLGTDMREQNRQVREDMNIRFEEQSRLILGLLAVFGAIVAVNISLVVWDRRTAARSFEDKVTGIADELAEQRSRVSVLVEAFRAVGQQNQTVAAVLKRFNLL